MLSLPFDALVTGARYVDRPEVKGRKQLMVASVASRPASLFNTFLSPGYGFAIIDSLGKVLFHSEMARNLHETLYDELLDPAPLRSAVLSGGAAEFETAYDGKDYRFLAAPFAAFEGSNWTLVVFSNKDYFRAALSGITKVSLSIYAFYAMVISTVIGLLLWLTTKRNDPLAQGLNLLVWVWPNPRKYGNYAGFVVAFAVAIVLLSAGVLAGPGLWLVFAAFLLPPAALVGGHALSRRWADRFQGAGHARPWNVAYNFFTLAMVLFALLVVMLPLTVFYQIAFDQELRDMQRSEVLQWEVHLRERQEAARAAAWQLQEKLDEENRAGLVDAQLREDFKFGVYAGVDMAPRPPACEPPRGDGITWLTSWFSTLYGSSPARIVGSRSSAGSRAQWCRPPAEETFSIVRSGADFPFALASQPVSWTLPRGWAGAACVALPLLLWAGLTFLHARLFGVKFTVPFPAGSQSEILASHFRASTIVLTKPTRSYGIERDAQWEVREIPVKDAADWFAGLETPSVKFMAFDHFERVMDDPQALDAATQLIETWSAMRIRMVLCSSVDPLAHASLNAQSSEPHAQESSQRLPRLSKALGGFRKIDVAAEEFRAAAPRTADDLSSESTTRIGMISAMRIFDRESQADDWLGHGSHRNEFIGFGRESKTELINAIRWRADAHYRDLWRTCSVRERVVLSHLAKEGVINAQSRDELGQLLRKGLVGTRPSPRVMNESFRRFVRDMEEPQLKTLEHSATGGWGTLRNYIWPVLLIAGGFLLVTQRKYFDNMLPILSIAAAEIAALFKTFDGFRSMMSSVGGEKK